MNAILTDGTFVPRAVTRDASSESALKLKASGAEVVQADFLDIESLKEAIAGSEGVFGVSCLAISQAICLAHRLSGYQTPDERNRSGQKSDCCLQGSRDQVLRVQVMASWRHIPSTILIQQRYRSSLPSATKISNGKYPDISPFDSE